MLGTFAASFNVPLLMTLIRSISGIRGTIGGAPGTGLTPLDTVRYAAAFGTFIRDRARKERPRLVLGRDARLSGTMVRDLVGGTLAGLGFDVIDLGLATTPTVEFAVMGEKAARSFHVRLEPYPMIAR